jgi:hypothetical protein
MLLHYNPLPNLVLQFLLVQDRQNEWSEEKYQQVIDSIKMKGEEVDNYTI